MKKMDAALMGMWKRINVKQATTPTHFMKTFLMQYKDPVSPKKIWDVYTSIPELYASGIFTSLSHMKRAAVVPLIKSGDVVRTRAVDAPRFKNAGMQT